MARAGIIALVIACAAACAQTLPEHDNRIFTAAPVAKLSAADLVKAFTADPDAARRRFVGEAIEVSGVVRVLPENVAQSRQFQLHAGDTDPQVQISLHEDRAEAIAKTLNPGQRLTLRCFCEGLSTHVQLKSCVVP
ncbi:MAG: hypothetical protein AMXMBFR57_10330 [Acidimicrobiia bacterium]|jgi:hypothetical protein